MSKEIAIDTERSQRSFRIDDIPYNGRIIKTVALEHEPMFINDQSIVPYNWLEQVDNVLNQASVTFLEYFPPELEVRAFSNSFAGLVANEYAHDHNITGLFGIIADIARAKNKQVAVSDIANKTLFGFYETTRDFPVWNSGIGIFSTEESEGEKYKLHTTDARRILTAKGIMQEADRRIEGSTIAYIAPPAHVNRVRSMIQNGLSVANTVKGSVYKHALLGLDRTTRLYKPIPQGWQLISEVKIN